MSNRKIKNMEVWDFGHVLSRNTGQLYQLVK